MGLRVGVIGTGKLGREHVRVLKRVPEVESVACYDIHPDRSRAVSEQFGAEVFASAQELLDAVDAVSVVVPTTEHANVSVRAFESGKSIFLEKPIAATVQEAKQIIEAGRRAGRVLQIGHVERFNAALAKALPHIVDPTFIEIHRLAPFTVRGIDVSVVMDLMIHDLDLLGLFLGAPPVDIRAVGAGILTNGPDIVNARLEYANGCVANITASRVSVQPMRKVRVFSKTSYVSMDLLNRTVRRLTKGEKFDEGVAKLAEYTRDGAKPAEVSLEDFIEMEDTKANGEEPLFSELQAFCRSIETGTPPVVTGEDGLMALVVATDIQQVVTQGRIDPGRRT